MKFAIKEQDLGVWIDSEGMTTTEFNVAIVDLAVTAGLPLDKKTWEKSKKKYLKHKNSVVKELELTTDQSLEFLNQLMPETHQFRIKREMLVVDKRRKRWIK